MGVVCVMCDVGGGGLCVWYGVCMWVQRGVCGWERWWVWVCDVCVWCASVGVCGVGV